MNIALVGQGRIGKLFKNMYKDEIVGIVSPKDNQLESLFDIDKKVDVIVDFSHPYLLDDIISFSLKNKIPVVIGTTGFSDKDYKKIELLSKKIPLVLSSNYSIGICLIKKILPIISQKLMSFDASIIETHHKNKIDCPSGTSLDLKESILKGNNTLKDVDIVSLRKGNTVGEHEVRFFLEDEEIRITHIAHSKIIFVKGAYLMCRKIINIEPGLYKMEDFFREF